jgi:hypothetical protein
MNRFDMDAYAELKKWAPRCWVCGKLATTSLPAPVLCNLYKVTCGDLSRLTWVAQSRSEQDEVDALQRWNTEWRDNLLQKGLVTTLSLTIVKIPPTSLSYYCEEHRSVTGSDLPYRDLIMQTFASTGLLSTYPTRFEREDVV